MVVRRRAAAARLEVLLAESDEPMLVLDPATGAIADANPAATAALDRTVGALRTVRLTDIAADGWIEVARLAGVRNGEPATVVVLRDAASMRTDAVLGVDAAGIVRSANPTALRQFGGDPSGRPLGELLEGSGDEVIDVRSGLRLGGTAEARRLDGSTFPVEVTVTSAATGTTVVVRDVTERRALERRLLHVGTHDALTGLPNRVLFMDRLAHALVTANRTERAVAVLFCDLDRFKVVNDSLGHSAGDALLVNVARRFRSALRERDTVARFGGDEFVVLAEDLADERHAVVVAEKLAASLDEPVRIGGQDIHVSSSMGIAVAGDGATPEALLRDADAAMYRAKATGKSRYVMFDGELRRQALERLATESALRRGAGLREFLVHYQPEVELGTGQVSGVEALVRWDHPDLGVTAPAAFLPIAEETGIIVAIGEQVVHQACAQAAAWRARHGERTPTVWVNVSARQLASPSLADVLVECVDAHGLRAADLGIEITETDIVPDDERSAHTMRRLTDLGHPIAIDDFGTGFASLSYLWRFPASVIKIDQAFVQRLDEGREAAALIEAMIQMAHSLGKTTVAEGVETDAHLDLLRELGCDSVQGYLLGRPAPAPALDALLA